MVRLRTVLGITAVVHIVLAWLVRLDAKKRGDDAGKWVVTTLLTGVFGVAKYIQDGR
ncbi:MULTISPECIES: hypothetical protein [Haloferax]|uniref:Uncharacterized protein n=1 Tax=Haloferax mediterranei (strain ATCC 33500 / DSM 1411 / JCM 8866 / NBRC 14739 / NCIMB 2177 / R-4) TaxID=523841 RepID=M0IVA0_HALMT|nr:hypothetical protein [Haloferax mediterranei]ELZ99972.1 hypothetical protein C439_11573 [Haloferax mediterranei ATCC 33500]MDX5987606.1 hypothetical protein [Haloferax mediterranei ATCC 33500]